MFLPWNFQIIIGIFLKSKIILGSHEQYCYRVTNKTHIFLTLCLFFNLAESTGAIYQHFFKKLYYCRFKRQVGKSKYKYEKSKNKLSNNFTPSLHIPPWNPSLQPKQCPI